MLYLICDLDGTTAYELCYSPLRFYYTSANYLGPEIKKEVGLSPLRFRKAG